MAITREDLTGKSFGRWTVVSKGDDYVYPINNKHSPRYNCTCVCGYTGLVHASHLKNGTSTSCGCFNVEKSSTHGLSNTREYSSWYNMMQRCYSPSKKDAKYYKDRGITVSQEWHDFLTFYEDMGNCPDGFEIERLDNNIGYSLENCIWADQQTQSQNRRTYSNNTSGRTGVTWEERLMKWRVTLCVNKKIHRGGCFPRIEDAIEKRIAMEVEFLGYEKTQ